MSVPLGRLVDNDSEPVGLADIDVMPPNDLTNTVGTHGSLLDVKCITDTACVGFCGNWTSHVPRFQKTLTDMQMIRVPAGDILHAELGAEYVSPGIVFCGSSDPLSCGSCDVGAAEVERDDALLLQKSSDCGQSWTPYSHIAATQIASGNYQHFDREEMYYDRFSDTVFMTVGAHGTDAAGTMHFADLVYRSTDHGKTWNETDPAVLPNRYEPAPMTSTSNHALYIARCNPGDLPELDWSQDGGKTFRSFAVPYNAPGPGVLGIVPIPCGHVKNTDLFRDFRNVFPSITISRGPDLTDTGLRLDVVRVAYSSVENVHVGGTTAKRAVLRVVNVYVPLDPATDRVPIELELHGGSGLQVQPRQGLLRGGVHLQRSAVWSMRRRSGHRAAVRAA